MLESLWLIILSSTFYTFLYVKMTLNFEPEHEQKPDNVNTWMLALICQQMKLSHWDFPYYDHVPWRMKKWQKYNIGISENLLLSHAHHSCTWQSCFNCGKLVKRNISLRIVLKPFHCFQDWEHRSVSLSAHNYSNKCSGRKYQLKCLSKIKCYELLKAFSS